jgi:hypothetical protein
MGDGGSPAFEALLVRLREQGGQRFDGAGWHYLDTLAQRALAEQGSVRRLLLAKVERAASAFSQRFVQARAAAAELLASACAQHPQAAGELHSLFAAGDFRRLRQLCATLAARAQCTGLAALVARIEPAPAGTPDQPAASQATASASYATPVNPATLELKTVRESRAAWARMSVDRQLSQAMKQAPVNAGPINSHMLVLRSLAMMQDISPDYLSRMVSYIDTLLALAPGEVEAPVKRKKTAAAKTARPRASKK